MRRETLLNALSGPVQILVNVLLVLLIVPLFIDALGLRLYGVYALISVVGSLGVFTTFGLNTSLIKYIAEQREKQESDYDILVTLILIAGTTLGAGMLAVVFDDVVLISILALGEGLVDSSVRWFYYTTVGAAVVQVVGQVPAAVLDAQQKVYVTNSVNIVAGSAGRIAVIASLLLAPDLMTIGWLMFLSAVAGTGLLMWFAGKTWGPLRVPALKRRFLPTARKHLMYSRSIYATAVTNLFYEPLTKILLSHFVGLTEVGFFDIALRVKTLIWNLLERLLYPVLPLLASRSAAEHGRTLVHETQQKILLFVVPLLIAVPFLTPPVISVWLGDSMTPVVLSVTGIVSCYLLAVLFLPVYQFLTIKGHPGKTLILQLTNVGVNLVLFAVLVPMVGYYGALTAYCLAVLASSALCVRYQHAFLGSMVLTSRTHALRVGGLIGGLLIVNAGVSAVIRNDWLGIAALVLANGAVTALLFRVLGMVTSADLDRYVGRQSRLGLFLGRIFLRETR